jgi:hypothetical protein
MLAEPLVLVAEDKGLLMWEQLSLALPILAVEEEAVEILLALETEQLVVLALSFFATLAHNEAQVEQ